MEQLQRTEQQLTQQQLQNLELLQMSEQELRDYIQKLSLENPVIEEVAADPEPVESSLVRDSEKDLAKWRWLESGDIQNRSYHPDWNNEDFSPLDLVGSAGGLEESLPRFLRSQLELRHIGGKQLRILRYLIDCLDEDGYLRIPLSELAQELGIPENEVRSGLLLLQQLEPAGVGAADLSECLKLQLIRRNASPAACRIAESHLEDLARFHDNAIAQALGISRQEVQEARELIRELDPRPGSRFFSGSATVYVCPDIYITESEGLFTVRIAREEQPWFTTSPYYQQLLKETEDEEVKHYLAEKFRQIEGLKFGIRQRESTLRRCTEAILLHQTDYFRLGSAALKPLSMTEIAEELGVHVSTVSRAVKNKYLQSSQGTVPLHFFFSQRASQNEDTLMGSRGAMALLKELIDGEDKACPLSDQKLCERMAARGCEISRRTVAKYRDLMNIPGTAGRRRQ